MRNPYNLPIRKRKRKEGRIGREKHRKVFTKGKKEEEKRGVNIGKKSKSLHEKGEGRKEERRKKLKSLHNNKKEWREKKRGENGKENPKSSLNNKKKGKKEKVNSVTTIRRKREMRRKVEKKNTEKPSEQ